MPISFSDVWNTWLYNAEEDPREAYVVVPQEAPIMPESEQPVDDLNAFNSRDAEASDTETSTTEKGNIDNLASCAETVPSNLPDDSQIEAENEPSELVVDATDASIFLMGHTNANSPAAGVSDTESSNTEEGKMGNLDSTAETATSNLPDDSQNKAESEQFKLGFLPTDASTGHPTDDSDSKTIVNEDPSSSPSPSSPAEDKLRKKLFIFDTAASTIGLLVPVLAIGFGAENIGNCPANFYMPYIVLIMGALSLFIVSYALLTTNRENFDCWTKLDVAALFVASYILIVLWFCKDAQFFTMDVSFDSSATNYCNYSFYIFNIVLDIFLAMGVIMGSTLFDLHYVM